MNVVQIKNMALVHANEEQRDRLKRSLTLSNKYTQEVLTLYKEREGDYIEIPIGMIPRPVNSGTWKEIDIQFQGKLKADQIPLVMNYIRHIENCSGGIIQSPTGSGKTIMAIDIMSRLKLKTLVIVPTDYLMKQWTERLLEHTNLQSKEIGICRGDICEFKNEFTKVVIGMIHSLAKPGRYPESFYKEFGLCVIDEVHKLSAPTFSQSLPQFFTKYRLGMSATARRKDGLENVFFFHIGRICSASTKQDIKPTVFMMKYDDEASHHEGCVWGGELSLGRYFNKLAVIDRRNNFIADAVKRMYDKGRDILILSDRIRQLNLLQLKFKKMNVSLEDVGIFTGVVKIGLDRKILLATYGSAGLGADIPRLSAVVFATPRVDVEQSMGRVLRVTQDKPQLVLDIIDVRSSIMRKWAGVRMKYYQQVAGKLHII